MTKEFTSSAVTGNIICLSVTVYNAKISASIRIKRFSEGNYIATAAMLDEIVKLAESNLKLLSKYFSNDFKIKPFTASQIVVSSSDEYMKYVKLNIADGDGNTEIIKIVLKYIETNYKNIEKILFYLIDTGYDLEQCNNRGESALSIMIEQKEYLSGYLKSYIEKIILEKEINQHDVIGLGL